MNKFALFALLVSATLLFGCLGGGSPTATPTIAPSVQPSIEPTATATATPTATVTVTPTATPGTASVEIKEYAFNPARLTVKKGTTVIWTNRDSVGHTVTSDTGSELESQTLKQGQSYSHTFDAVGLYTYHCNPHPIMKATVEVVE